jgi:SAM-dependent methyltransferase
MTMYSKFAAWYDRIFPFSPGVYAYLTHHLGDRGGPVLDLGCGTGDYCAAFTRDGVTAAGLDLDEAMISQARLRGPDTEFHVMDMAGFAALEGPWNMIYSIGNTAAHLPRERFWACAGDVAGRLLPHGVWIVQVMNWDYVLGLRSFVFPPKVMDGAVFHRAYEDIGPGGLTFSTALDIDGERVFEDQVRLYPIPSVDMIAGHERLGFRLVEHVSDYAGSGFDPDVFSASLFVFTR